ncbi:MAG: 6-bladed beta-propeller [bacterium]
MIKIKYYVFLIFTFTFLITWSCQNQNSFSTEAKILIKKRITLNIPDGKVIGSIFDLAFHGGNNSFCIADFNNHYIWLFDSSGNYLRHFGHLGKGPGDLNKPMAVAVKSDSIAVLDTGNKSIKFFNWKGEYLREFRIPNSGMASGIAWSYEIDRIIVSESLGMIHYSYWDRDGTNLKLGHSVYHLQGILMPIQLPGGSCTQTPEGHLLYANPTKYDVIRLNWEGDTLYHYTTNPQNYNKPALESKAAYMKQKRMNILLTPFQLGKYVIVQRMGMEKNKNGIIISDSEHFKCDIFNKIGHLIAKGLTHSQLPAIASDHKYLYAIDYSGLENELQRNPEIVVLELKIQKNDYE